MKSVTSVKKILPSRGSEELGAGKNMHMGFMGRNLFIYFLKNYLGTSSILISLYTWILTDKIPYKVEQIHTFSIICFFFFFSCHYLSGLSRNFSRFSPSHFLDYI